MDKNYLLLLAEIKATIQSEPTRAARQLTRSVIGAYWEIGRKILESQKMHSWGKAIVEQLSKDLQRDFPGREGFSARNLWNMRLFYETYQASPILQQVVAVLASGSLLPETCGVCAIFTRQIMTFQICDNLSQKFQIM